MVQLEALRWVHVQLQLTEPPRDISLDGGDEDDEDDEALRSVGKITASSDSERI